MAKIASTSTGRPTHEEIAERARQIYEQSGCIQGRDEANWLQAESELIAARKLSTSPQAHRPATATRSNNSRPTTTKTSQTYA